MISLPLHFNKDKSLHRYTFHLLFLNMSYKTIPRPGVVLEPTYHPYVHYFESYWSNRPLLPLALTLGFHIPALAIALQQCAADSNSVLTLPMFTHKQVVAFGCRLQLFQRLC